MIANRNADDEANRRNVLSPVPGSAFAIKMVGICFLNARRHHIQVSHYSTSLSCLKPGE
jgi:hypothetical protein